MIDSKTLHKNLWLMHEAPLERMHRDLLGRRELPPAAVIEKWAEEQGRKAALRKVSGKVGIIPVQGVIEQKSSIWSYYFGGFSTESGEQQLNQLLAARDVEAIVLDIDSPGGTSYGVEEFADLIFQARGTKPIHACANSMACSAAYWIASACSSITCTPSGDVGSVGVYSMHVDYSKALEEAGVKVTLAHAGKYKTEFQPYDPLSEEAKAYMQESVEACYIKFTADVARNRGAAVSTVKARYGQGRVLGAEQALEAGMIDRIDSFAGVLTRLGGQPTYSQGGRSAASMDVLRARHEQDKARRGETNRREQREQGAAE